MLLLLLLLLLMMMMVMEVVVLMVVVVVVVGFQGPVASDKPPPLPCTTVSVCLKVLISGAELSDLAC